MITFNPHQVTLVALLPASGGFIPASELAGCLGEPVERVRSELAPLVAEGVVTYDQVRDEYEIAED